MTRHTPPEIRSSALPPTRPAATAAAISLVVRRSLRRHALSSTITAAITALAAGLVIAVFALQSLGFQAFAGGAAAFDAVLGARGSRLQLALNTLFHVEQSPGNIPWSWYESMRADPRVELAIPYALGDNYLGHRIIGTTPEYLEKGQPTRRPFEFEPGGRAFDAALREAVIGCVAADRTGLRVGDTFHPHHGLVHDPNAAHDDEHDEFLVVGILKPTHSPADRAIWIPIDAVFRISGHMLGSGDDTYEAVAGVEIPAEYREISAVMLRLKSPQFGFDFDQRFNKEGSEVTFAWPIAGVLSDLFSKINWMAFILRLVAVFVLIVSAAAILASLYNTINERRREFAILRALGARPMTIFTAILVEAKTIAALGAMAGMLIGFGLLLVARTIIREQTGVVLDPWTVHPAFIWTPLGTIALGGIAGILPASKAYSSDVATHLATQV